MVKGESPKGGKLGGSGVAPTPADAGISAGGVAVAVAEAPQAGPAPPKPPRPPLDPPPVPEAAASLTQELPAFTSAAPTPPRPPIPQPPEPPRPPSPPVSGTGGVTATVSALEPKGLRARLRRAKPRNLAIAGAVAASVVAAAAVLGFLLLGPTADEDRPAEYAFDSDAVHRVTDGIDSSISPGDSTAPGDPNSLWNYGVTPLNPTGSTSGTSKYAPPYRSGTSGNFIPYKPPGGSSGSSGGGDDGGGGASGPAPQAMPAGGYSYGGSGAISFLSKVTPVPATVAATVTNGDGGCSTISMAAGGATVASTYCAAGGALTAGPRIRNVGGQLSMTCPGVLLPAGAQSAAGTEVACTASSGPLSETLHGSSSVADAGNAWVASTAVTAANGDAWSEQVTIDKASGKVVALVSNVRFPFLSYQESSTFNLR